MRQWKKITVKTQREWIVTDFIINPPFLGSKTGINLVFWCNFIHFLLSKVFQKISINTSFGVVFCDQMAHLNTKSGEKIGLASKFLCQEENHENPVFPVATIVVDVMIEWFCLYASIQTKSPHHSTTLTGKQPENRKKQKIMWEPNWLYTVHFLAVAGCSVPAKQDAPQHSPSKLDSAFGFHCFSFEKVGILARMRWWGWGLYLQAGLQVKDTDTTSWTKS